MIREIVKIDEEKCNGCGLCVPSCAEGAIKIVDGKAKLISDNLCDGLGACLGSCPMDAIIIEKRSADAFDEEAVEKHLQKEEGGLSGCPSARVMSIDTPCGCPSSDDNDSEEGGENRPSELRQWPVQMHLVPPTAPFLQGAEILLAADCAPFAYADFHKDILKGKALLIGCPKLDDGQAYLEKLTAMLKGNNVKSLSVAHMEVPCCSGLISIVREAIAASGVAVPLETICVGIKGDLK